MTMRRPALLVLKTSTRISADDAIRLYRAARSRSNSLEHFRRALHDIGLDVVQRAGHLRTAS